MNNESPAVATPQKKKRGWILAILAVLIALIAYTLGKKSGSKKRAREAVAAEKTYPRIDRQVRKFFLTLALVGLLFVWCTKLAWYKPASGICGQIDGPWPISHDFPVSEGIAALFGKLDPFYPWAVYLPPPDSSSPVIPANWAAKWRDVTTFNVGVPFGYKD